MSDEPISTSGPGQGANEPPRLPSPVASAAALPAEYGDGPTDAATDEKRLPFTEHLRELRTRTIRAVAYVLVGFGIAWGFHEELFAWLMAPYSVAILGLDPASGADIAFRSLIEPIVVYLKTALVVGGIATMPFVLLEIWLFIAPGLYKEERKLALPFLVATIFFFVGGAFFCRYIVFEPAMHVLLNFGGDNTTPTIMMQEYFSFTSRMLFVFGALFELPVVVSFLSMVGLVTPEFLIRNWRYAVVITFVVGAVMTPPDPLTQIALAVPLVILYVISIGLSWMIVKRKKQTEAEVA